MNVNEFRAAGIALFGAGWQSKMARALGVNARTVRRWASGEVEIPPTVAAALSARPAIARDYPDEWLIAADPDEEREYLLHLASPRFVARLGDDDDLHEGLTMALRDEVLFDFTWIDPAPATNEMRALLRGAQIAVDEYSR